MSVLAFGLLLLSLATGSALADDLDGQNSALPSSEEVIQAIESEEPQSVEIAQTDPVAAENLPHQDLGREEALQLLQGVFEAQLESPIGIFDDLQVETFLSPNVAVVAAEPATAAAGVGESDTPSTVGDERPDSSAPMTYKEELRAQATGRAVGDPEGPASDAGEPSREIAGAVLLESSVPLQTQAASGQLQPVDLSLEHDEGELQPVNPLVDVGIPQELGEGIELPGSRVNIELVGAPENRSPSVVGESIAFLPNVATDTDLAVVPAPGGVETFTQLRSADAPLSQTFQLALPAGASLQTTDDGGAAVVREEETLLMISSPTAIDATGAGVPVSLEVSDSSFTLAVTPDGSAKFPILIDPLIQTYEWGTSKYWQSGLCNSSFEFKTGGGSCNTAEEWGFEHIENRNPTHIRVMGQYYGMGGPVPQGTPGIFIETNENLTTGDRGSAFYTVPRYFTDQGKYGSRPTSFISQMTLWNLDWTAHSSYLSPYLFAGIWDPFKPGWVSYYSHEGLVGHSVGDMSWKYQFPNSQPNTNAKVGYVTVQATETQPSQYTEVYVGSASIQLADNGAPGFGSIAGPSVWVDQTPAPISFTASDSGLGVHSLTASPDQPITEGAGYSWKTAYGCIGVSGAACPRTWSSTDAGRPVLKYEPSVLPTGINYVKVVAEDPVGNKSSPAYAQVKVDHVMPQVSLSGTMTEQAVLGTKRPSYTLRVDASDGTVEQPQSGVAKTVIKVDGIVVDEFAPGCATKSCGISREWTLDSSKYSEGEHTVTVVATDAVGIPSATKTLVIELDPSPPSLALSGTITEQSTLGTSRPRYRLKLDASAIAGVEAPQLSQPTFSSSFGSLGTGSGQFKHPAGIAIDPKGNLWVIDQGNNRVQKFSASGEYLSSFGSLGAGNGQFETPASIAIDPKGNLLVADAGNSRVQKFNEQGEYLSQFGSFGFGNGEFLYAEGIAVDPKGNIWVGDTYNGRLQKFNEAGEFLQVVGSYGSGEGQLGEPTDLDIGPGGQVWVADWQNNRVAVFDEAGQFVRQFGTYGTGNGQFNRPDVIDVDTMGNVWVGDQNNARVQAFSQSGEYLAQFGTKGSGQGQFSFGWPMGIATDSNGGIWVADTGNHRLQKWLVPGYRPGYDSSFGGLGTAAGQLSKPADVAIDAHGDLWVADKANHRIQKFNAKGEFLSQFGAQGSGDGQFNSPAALAIGGNGDIWVADQGNGRIQRFDSEGKFLSKFGVMGFGAGKLISPGGVAIDASGAIWVTDWTKVQKFTPGGEFIERVGTAGSAPGQMSQPRGIDLGPEGNFFVAEAQNHRVSVFNEAGTFVRHIGSQGSGAGQLTTPSAIEVDGRGDVWVGDVGNGRIQQFSRTGEYITQFGNAGSGDGQLSLANPMGIASHNDGSIWVTDPGNNRVQKWTRSPSESEITAEISVDGKVVDVGDAGCIGETCPLVHEWMLDSSANAAGQHTVAVKASDGLGNTSSKSLSIDIERDTDKPVLEAGGELVEAPEGWVEQETYGITATATDGGYGVTSVSFRIDEEQIASVSQLCSEGGCQESLTSSIDVSAYSGGAHPAELVATDGAGNVTKNAWTINVDPEGHISTEEAIDTLEAVDATSLVNTVGEAQEEELYEGTVPGLTVEEVNGEGKVTGTHVPTTIAAEPSDGITMQILEVGAFATPCSGDSGGTAESEEVEEVQEEGAAVEPCIKPGEPEELEGGDLGLEPIQVTPVSTSGDATGNTITYEAATVAANTSIHVDTVIRPLYDGVMTFAALRDTSAPETYSWEVRLEPDQELKLIDEQHAAVYYEGGYPAFAITAEPAHDAIGTSVSTGLSISEGKIVTLTVNHHAAAYVYPVIAGAGWEGGFKTEVIEGPLDELELKEKREEEERIERERREAEEEGIEFEEMQEGEHRYTESAMGPPIADSSSVPFVAAQPNSVRPTARAYNFVNCHWTGGSYPAPPGVKLIREVARGCHGVAEGTNGYYHIKWAVSMSGVFHYKYGHWVWVNEQPNCRKWGEEGIKPAIVHCRRSTPNPSDVRLDILGDLRFGPNDFVPIRATCAEFDGILPTRPKDSRPYYGKSHFKYMPVWPSENCPWGHFINPAGF